MRELTMIFRGRSFGRLDEHWIGLCFGVQLHQLAGCCQCCQLYGQTEATFNEFHPLIDVQLIMCLAIVFACNNRRINNEIFYAKWMFQYPRLFHNAVFWTSKNINNETIHPTEDHIIGSPGCHINCLPLVIRRNQWISVSPWTNCLAPPATVESLLIGQSVSHSTSHTPITFSFICLHLLHTQHVHKLNESESKAQTLDVNQPRAIGTHPKITWHVLNEHNRLYSGRSRNNCILSMMFNSSQFHLAREVTSHLLN